MQPLKIVVTGTYAAGKTHFIRSISDIDVVSTETAVSQVDELQIKRETTVALDFGTIAISKEIVLYLFGTPGQERFDFMWDVLAEGCIGYVVMIDSCRPAHFVEAQRLIAHFANVTDASFIVAANKQDDPTALPLSYIRKRLQLHDDIPLVSCVATEKQSVKHALLTLLTHIEQQSLAYT